jgi:DNA-binding response OmpR family regulator
MNKKYLVSSNNSITKPSHGLVALIVEDDPLVARGIARVLEISGFRTEIVGSVREGLEYFVSFDPPHLLTLDLNLPNGSGLLLIEALNGIGALNETVTAVVSGAKDSELEKAMEAGADICLCKPFSFEEFQEIEVAMSAKAYYGRRS